MLIPLNRPKQFLLAASCWLAAMVAFSSLAAELGALTNAAQLRATPSPLAARQLPVKLRAIATAFNPSSIFLQDDTGGTFINLLGEHPPLTPGDVLEVEG